jgi:small subunit ribosomal protein S6|tara:strand:+ start:139 stop:447 length:309 start_codon:yes stop_codon:yes gene_type:complete
MKKEVELYEIMYLLKPNFTDQELAKEIDLYKELLINEGSQVMVQNRGKRQLSYPIKGFETATYVQMLYLGNGELNKTLQRAIARDSSVLRHLTTKVSNLETI